MSHFCVDTNEAKSFTELPGVQNVTLYSYKELAIATNDYSPENKIGEGGFGSVYKVKESRLVVFIALEATTVHDPDLNSLVINRENLGMGRWLQLRFSLLTRHKE